MIEASDGLGQKYVTPEVAVGKNNTDVIIVGRAILNVSNKTVCVSKVNHICIIPSRHQTGWLLQ